MQVLSFRPFDPTSKITESMVQRTTDGVTFRVAKGAPHVIIRMAGNDHEAAEAVYDYAVRGLRCLGVARSDPISATADPAAPVHWHLVGLLAFLDPPRPDSAHTIVELGKLGVMVKMITGDQQVIGKEVAKRLGMHRTILTPDRLNDRALSEHALAQRCLRADGFAQVVPEDKFRVVELLQKEGMLIGMTGDGVNDAPALKKADVGIAVHGCTDAARSAADVVLMSPGLSVIVDAVRTARAIFQRMRSYALYRITSTVHFLIFFFISIIALRFVLPPILIVLICLLNDAATLVISVDNALISDKPDKWRLGQLLSLSVLLGLILTASSFAIFFIARDAFGLDRSQINSIIYLQMYVVPPTVTPTPPRCQRGATDVG
jgi:H+-transporting ATPase